MTRTGLDLTYSTPLKSRRQRRLVLRIALAVFTSLLVSSHVYAQDERHPQRGFNPGASYALSDMESISTTSGNLIFNVPLGSLPAGRAGSPGFTLGLTYNSKLYDTRIDSVPNDLGQNENRTDLGQSQDGGWRYTLPSGYAMRLVSRLDEEPGPGCTSDTGAFEYQKNSYIFKVQVLYPDGSAHDFRPNGYTDQFDDGFFNITPNGWLISNGYVTDGESASCTHNETLATTAPMVYYSTDGSYTRLVVQHDPNTSNHTGAFNQWTLYFPDGRRVTNNPGEPQRTYDRNNNYVDLVGTTVNGHPAQKIVDQFGRYITIETGVGQTDPATETWSRQDYVYVYGTGGDQMVLGVHWKRIYVYKQYYAAVESGGRSRGNTYLTPWEGVYEVVDQITLPSQAGGNLSYTFGYNAGDYTSKTQTLSYGWGELSSVTLPSGAKTSYGYVLDGVSAPAGTSLPQAKNVLNNKPKSKTLVYRQEYDLTSPVSNSPCDTNVEQCTSEVWLYAGDDVHDTDTPQITSITGPDGGVTSESFDLSTTSIYYSHSGATVEPDGTKVERLWQENRSTGMTGQNVNPFVKTEFTSVMNAASPSNYVKTAIKDYTYDKNGNVTSVSEYDWVDYASVPRDAAGRPSGLPQGITPKKVTTNRYYNQTPDASDTTTVGPNAYYQASAPQWLGALQSSEVGDSSHTLARTELYYDDAGTTGNLTEQRSWDSTKGALLGNPSSGSRLDSTNSISVFNEYDPQTKNRTAAVDANGVRTSYVYGAVAVPSGQVTDLYPTEVRAADGTAVQRRSLQEYDFYTGLVTKATDADNNVYATTTYDVFGRPTLVKSGLRDGQVLPEETHTTTVYSDVDRRVIVRSDLNTKGDGKLVSIQHYDQLGRVRLSRRLEDTAAQSETDETAGIKVQTRYMYSGNNGYMLTSNPYRAATSSASPAESTMGWTISTVDQAGRVVRVETFDGAGGLPAPWGTNGLSTGAVTTVYDAEKKTVTDQAGNARQSVMDGLDRLAQIVEAPGVQNYGFLTSYTYDALGNLTKVSQGVQTRTFSYSSLSRLTSVSNPESGVISYEYDKNGNLKKKTDPRFLPNTQTHITITYDYDELNRIKTRNYNDNTPNGNGTPNVTYAYDTAANGKGRLASISSSVSTNNYVSYDALGRVTASSQITDGVTYSIPSYQYNLAGDLISEQYPSGRVVKTEYDMAGRVAGVRNQASGLYYAGATSTDSDNRIQYAANGAAIRTKLGNGLWEHTVLNTRLQPMLIGLGTSGTDASVMRLDYTYGVVVNGALDTTKNNGNLQSQSITALAYGNDPAFSTTQTYSYDPLNRLGAAWETHGTQETWRQTYSYDPYGNRRLDEQHTTRLDYNTGATVPVVTDGNRPSINPAIDPSTNRISEGGYKFDEAGNMLCVTGQCSNSDVTAYDEDNPNSNLSIFLAYYVYDAENHMTSAGGGAQAGGSDYTYDGGGQRVKKVWSSQVTVFVYDAAGKMVAEYSNQVNNGGTSYLTQDTLGSTRVVTNKDKGVVSRHDYQPFGEEINPIALPRTGREALQSYNLGSVKQKFTGKERDIETGLDYFGARYLSASQGRFTSCDPIHLTKQHIANPQRWNLYVYVNNNPLALTDPDGKDGQGKAGSKVIDIYIVFPQKVLNGHRMPNWKKIEQIAKKDGYEVKVHNYNESTVKNVEESLKNSTATIILTHTLAYRGDDPKKTIGVVLKDGYLTNQGEGSNGPGGSLQTNGVKPEANGQLLVLAGCNPSTAGALVQPTHDNYDLVVLDSGKNGETDIQGGLDGVSNFVKGYVEGGIQEGIDDANRAIKNGVRKHPLNRGDKFIHETINQNGEIH